jgi:hypothetical protein
MITAINRYKEEESDKSQLITIKKTCTGLPSFRYTIETRNSSLSTKLKQPHTGKTKLLVQNQPSNHKLISKHMEHTSIQTNKQTNKQTINAIAHNLKDDVCAFNVMEKP